MNRDQIKVAIQADMSFVSSLQKKFSNQLGFLPTMALENYIGMGAVRLAYENDCPAGYILTRGYLRFDPRICPVTQAAICYDAQRQAAGRELVTRIELEAIGRNQDCLQCWCAEDIEAVNFWAGFGFQRIMDRDPKNARGRRMILFRKRISDRPFDMWKIPDRAGYRGKKMPIEDQLSLFDASVITAAMCRKY